MHANQIDTIIDNILNVLYVDHLSKDKTFNKIISDKNLNLPEHIERINTFFDKFMKGVDTAEIAKLVNNKQNVSRIVDIIRKYLAYYYFIMIGFHFKGDIKTYRNNVIQLSKMQENLATYVEGFYNTDSNYKLILFFKLIKQIEEYLLMSDFQKKTITDDKYAQAIELLEQYGTDYVTNYLLDIIETNDTKKIAVNAHNLIKTIVFGEIYMKNDRVSVYAILNEEEELDTEHIYIDVVIEDDKDQDIGHYINTFSEYGEDMALDVFKLEKEMSQDTAIDMEHFTNNLLSFDFITAIADDYLRYHRDTHTSLNNETLNIPLVADSKQKNIQLLLQNKRKKENTRANVIINKVEAIANIYSNVVKNNQSLKEEIDKYFDNPFYYRKATIFNYLEELQVMTKIENLGERVARANEYYAELQFINSHAYFNFNEFKKYGVHVNIANDTPINIIRYSNIEHMDTMSDIMIDSRTGPNNYIVDLVGLSFIPFKDRALTCMNKSQLVNIADVTINNANNKKQSATSPFDKFLLLIQLCYIDTIVVDYYNKYYIRHDYKAIRNANPSLVDKVIYWIYDVEKDTFQADKYVSTTGQHGTIQLMNRVLWNNINDMLKNKLIQVIKDVHDVRIVDVYRIIVLFRKYTKLQLSNYEEYEILVSWYLRNIAISKLSVTEELEPIELPSYQSKGVVTRDIINVDMTNPTKVQEFIDVEERRKTGSVGKIKRDERCIHELELDNINSLRGGDFKKYNEALTDFIEKYVVETMYLDKACKICGQLLPFEEWVQHGSYDNASGRFITSYMPVNVQLADITEYSDYDLIISWMDKLLDRIDLIMGITMFDHTKEQKHSKKLFIKNVVDIVIRHNSVHMEKHVPEEKRLEYFSKHFGISKDLDSLYFFLLNNSILDMSDAANSTNIDEKYITQNNLVLYVLLMYITELNGAQIVTSAFNKYANVYVYFKHGATFFNNIYLKKNTSNDDTVPITDYPVLCYLLFIIAIMINSNGLWKTTRESNRKIDPYTMKIIINTMVALINSIAISAGNHPDDYIYRLVTSKIYTGLGNTFRRNEIIDALKRNQAKFSPKLEKTGSQSSKIDTIIINDSLGTATKGGPLPTNKVTMGIAFDNKDHYIYHYTETVTNLTNCPDGRYYAWKTKDSEVNISNCKVNVSEADGTIDRTEEAYYMNLRLVANKKCITGQLHDFSQGNVCLLCKKTKDHTYTKDELDKLMDGINKRYNDKVDDTINQRKQLWQEDMDSDIESDGIIESVKEKYKLDISKAGGLEQYISQFIDILRDYIGVDVNLSDESFPVYLDRSTYIITYDHEGVPYEPRLILHDADIKLIPNHPVYHVDILSYVTGKTTVFYSAHSLILVGYKEQHKDYVHINSSIISMIVSFSVKKQLEYMGITSEYVDIANMRKQKRNIYSDTNEIDNYILNDIRRLANNNIKKAIDKIISIIFTTRYNDINDDVKGSEIDIDPEVEKLVTKYGGQFKQGVLKLVDDMFTQWQDIRYGLNSASVQFENSNDAENTYINMPFVIKNDESRNILLYYLVNQLRNVFDRNIDTLAKTNFAQLFVNIIMYTYHTFDNTYWKNKLEIKRFEQIISDPAIVRDILSKEYYKKLQKESGEITDEKQDLLEQGEALDIDVSFETDVVEDD